MSAQFKIESLEDRKLLAATGTTSIQVGNTIYYQNSDPAHGAELWKSNADGSDAMLVADIKPGPDGSSPDSLMEFNGELVFMAYFPAAGTSSGDARMIGISDGTAAGTVPISEPNEPPINNPHFIALNGHLLFVGGNNELYSNDGIAGSTHLLYTVDPHYGTGAVLNLLGVQDGLLYFTTNNSTNRDEELWQTDGTVAGTTHVPAGVHVINGVLYVEGGSGDDSIQITGNSTTTTVTINGNAQDIDNSTFQTIWAEGQEGNDRIFLTADVKQNATLVGGAGDDTLTGGGGNDLLIGGIGHDTADYSSETTPITTTDTAPGKLGYALVISDRGTDYPNVETLLSGSGNDYLNIYSTIKDGIQDIDGGPGNDYIDLIRVEPGGPDLQGGGGQDTISGGNYTNPESPTNIYHSSLPAPQPPASPPPASPPPASPPPPVVTPPTVVYASLNNHVLSVSGTTGNDSILIRQKSGDASVLRVVVNGKISDFTLSDVHKLKVTASNGNDLVDLRGNNFVDVRDVYIRATILGGNGNDSVYGSDEADSIDGGRGDDYLCGMAGNDSITGGEGTDVIRGGDGVDRLFAHAGSDDLNKNKGDTIVNDVLG